MKFNLGFSDVTNKYSTCILFIPSEVTMELVNTIADHEFRHNSLQLPSYSI
jgi:hypothetical protein